MIANLLGEMRRGDLISGLRLLVILGGVLCLLICSSCKNVRGSHRPILLRATNSHSPALLEYSCGGRQYRYFFHSNVHAYQQAKFNLHITAVSDLLELWPEDPWHEVVGNLSAYERNELHSDLEEMRNSEPLETVEELDRWLALGFAGSDEPCPYRALNLEQIAKYVFNEGELLDGDYARSALVFESPPYIAVRAGHSTTSFGNGLPEMVHYIVYDLASEKIVTGVMVKSLIEYEASENQSRDLASCFWKCFDLAIQYDWGSERKLVGKNDSGCPALTR